VRAFRKPIGKVLLTTSLIASFLSVQNIDDLTISLFAELIIKFVALEEKFRQYCEWPHCGKKRFFKSSNWFNQFKVMRTEQTEHFWIRLASIGLDTPRSSSLWRVLKPFYYSLSLQLADRFCCWRTMPMMTVLFKPLWAETKAQMRPTSAISKASENFVFPWAFVLSCINLLAALWSDSIFTPYFLAIILHADFNGRLSCNGRLR
jgi:hypothetical protein